MKQISAIIKKWKTILLLVIFISLLVFYLKTKKISRFQDVIQLNTINTLTIFKDPVDGKVKNQPQTIQLTKWSENSNPPLLALLLKDETQAKLEDNIKIFKKDEIFFKNFEEITLFEDTNNVYYEENKIKINEGEVVKDINFSKHTAPILAISSNKKILLWHNQYDSYRFRNGISLDDMKPPKKIIRSIRNTYDEKWSRYRSEIVIKENVYETYERDTPKHFYNERDEISSIEWSPDNLLTIGITDGSIQLFDTNLNHKQTLNTPIQSKVKEDLRGQSVLLKWSDTMLATYLETDNNIIYIWKYNAQGKLEIIDSLEHKSKIKSISWCNIKDTPILTVVTENKKLYFWKQKNKTSKFRIIESDSVNEENSLLSWSNNKTNPVLVIYDNTKIDIWKYDSNKKSLDKLEINLINPITNTNINLKNIEWSPHKNPLLTIGNTNIFDLEDTVMENIEYEDPITGRKYKHKHVDIDPIRKGTQLRKGISLTPINNYIIQSQAPPKLPIYPDSQGQRQTTFAPTFEPTLPPQLVKTTLPPQLVKTTLPPTSFEPTVPPQLIKTTLPPPQILENIAEKSANYNNKIYILILCLILTSLLIMGNIIH